MSELKFCPFCGGEANTWDGVYMWYVVCKECGAAGSPCLAEAEAIEAWNTRAEQTCHDKARYGNFKCDVCNALLQLTDFDEEPMLTVDGVGYVPSYCPNCGRKVVR